VALPPPQPALPEDDDALDVAFDTLTRDEVEAIERFSEPDSGPDSGATADVDADELGVRAVRALEHLAFEMKRSTGETAPDPSALPEHMALALGRALSGRLKPGERAVLDRVLAADRIVATRAAELERLWPRVLAWLGVSTTASAGEARADEETPRSLRWMHWLPIVLVVAIGASMLVRFKPIFALFQESARIQAVPFVDASSRTAIEAGASGESPIIARRFLVSVDSASDTHLLLAAFPARGPAWRAFPEPALEPKEALIPAGLHVLPDADRSAAFEIPFDSGPTSIVAACRDEPFTADDLHEVDALLAQGSEAGLRAFLDGRGFRTEVLTVLEPDR